MQPTHIFQFFLQYALFPTNRLHTTAIKVDKQNHYKYYQTVSHLFHYLLVSKRERRKEQNAKTKTKCVCTKMECLSKVKGNTLCRNNVLKRVSFKNLSSQNLMFIYLSWFNLYSNFTLACHKIKHGRGCRSRRIK